MKSTREVALFRKHLFSDNEVPDDRSTPFRQHLFLKTDLPNTVLYQMKEFVRMLENASYLEDLAYTGIRTDVIPVVLEILREQLKDVEILQPIESVNFKKV